MDKLLRVLFNFKEFKSTHDDDVTDRLTRVYTSSILFLFCVIVTSSHYVGHIIQCWCPAEFTDSHKQYANTICWVSDTYYVPFNQHIPTDDRRPKQMISYYQWVPFILLVQGMLCYVPRLVWSFLNKKSGLNLSSLIDAAQAGQRSSYSDMREKTVRYIVFQLDRYLRAKAPRPRSFLAKVKHAVLKYCCMVCLQIRGSYLILCFLLTKLLYVANAVGQLYLLDVFLGTNYHFYGVDVMRRFLQGHDWSESERFPRVTLCNFDVRRQTKIHTHIVQCALPINLFNEKLFIFIWFWFVLLAALTVYSFIWWCWHIFYWPCHYKYMKQQISLCHSDLLKRHKQNLHKFTQYYLQKDGLFAIRLIAQNAGNMASAEVASGLWENYGPENSRAFNVQMGTPSSVKRGAPPTPRIVEPLLRQPSMREDI